MILLDFGLIVIIGFVVGIFVNPAKCAACISSTTTFKGEPRKAAITSSAALTPEVLERRNEGQRICGTAFTCPVNYICTTSQGFIGCCEASTTSNCVVNIICMNQGQAPTLTEFNSQPLGVLSCPGQTPWCRTISWKASASRYVTAFSCFDKRLSVPSTTSYSTTAYKIAFTSPSQHQFTPASAEKASTTFPTTVTGALAGTTARNASTRTAIVKPTAPPPGSSRKKGGLSDEERVGVSAGYASVASVFMLSVVYG